jgi:ABC-type polysaccharide/polyol phosphate export permease
MRLSSPHPTAFGWNAPLPLAANELADVMLGLTQQQVVTAADDIRVGIIRWRLGRLLAWQDIKQRYRRSTLGPIWLTLTSGIQMLVMGVMSSFLFNTPIDKSLPYVCAGGLFWALITNTVNEGGMLFLAAAGYITQIKICYTTFFVQIIIRNVIVFLHSFVIYICVALYYSVAPSMALLLWPVAFALVLVCIEWIVLIVSIISARYRDTPLIVQNIFTVLFWLTPVMYFPEQLGGKARLIEFNPLAHMIELLRAPLLGGYPSLGNWLVCIGVAIFGWAMAFLFFARFRSRIVFWL